LKQLSGSIYPTNEPDVFSEFMSIVETVSLDK